MDPSLTGFHSSGHDIENDHSTLPTEFFQTDSSGGNMDLYHFNPTLWSPNADLEELPGQANDQSFYENRFPEGSIHLDQEFPVLQSDMEPVSQYYKRSHPQIEEDHCFRNEMEIPRNQLGHTQRDNEIQNFWSGNRQHDGWALPNYYSVVEEIPPVPALTPPEPETRLQPRDKPRTDPKPRKHSVVKSESVRKNAFDCQGQEKGRKPGPRFQIFRGKDMTEVKKRPRVLSQEQRTRAALVRKLKACEACRRGHRACQHVSEEPLSPGIDDPLTPDGDVPMDIAVILP